MMLHYRTLQYTLQYSTLNFRTLQSLHHHHHHKRNCNYTTLHEYVYINYTTPLRNYNYSRSTPTLHPAIVGQVTNQVTTATIVIIPKHTAPTTFQSIIGFTLPPVFHNSQTLLYVSYSETSTIALN